MTSGRQGVPYFKEIRPRAGFKTSDFVEAKGVKEKATVERLPCFRHLRTTGLRFAKRHRSLIAKVWCKSIQVASLLFRWFE